MPRREGPVTHLHRLPLDERRKQDGRFQEHWYRLAAEFCRGRTVLDVGAGNGYGLDILRAGGAAHVVGCDPLPLRDDVLPCDGEGWGASAYDYVLALDVIEHVDDDKAFLGDLIRTARVGVFLTTPNWGVSRCANPHHVREYTPEELQELLTGLDWIAWTSDAERRISSGFDHSAPSFGISIRCA